MDPRPVPALPPAEVLAAWAVADVVPLAGGQGTAFASEELVLKPVLDDAAAEWVADTVSRLPTSDRVRVPLPVAAVDGRWVVRGWSAWCRVDGADDVRRWRDALRVCESFHALTAGVPWHNTLEATHPWAVGDRWAWGEQDLDVPDEFRGPATELVRRRQPVTSPPQLVHGDLIGNILYSDTEPPAVIDLSPYWRPVRYAAAIVAVDAMGWYGASPAEVVVEFRDDEGLQMLLRAVLFRLGSAIAHTTERPHVLADQVPVYERLARVVIEAMSG